jgi:hypothetical protein
LAYAHENGYEAFAYADCDMTYPVEDFPGMIAALPEYDLVTGVRKMERIAPHRRLVNLFFLLVVKILYGRTIGDLITGMRVLKVEKYVGKLTAPAFEIETEISCLALRDNYKIKEIPVIYSQRMGESKITLWDFFTNLWYILKVRFLKA